MKKLHNVAPRVTSRVPKTSPEKQPVVSQFLEISNFFGCIRIKTSPRLGSLKRFRSSKSSCCFSFLLWRSWSCFSIKHLHFLAAMWATFDFFRESKGENQQRSGRPTGFVPRPQTQELVHEARCSRDVTAVFNEG